MARALVCRLFFAENHFALAHKLVVEPQAVFVGCCFAAGARRAAHQANPRGRLKNIRRKGAAIHIKFHSQIAGIGNPRNLIAGVDDYRLRNQSNEYGAFSHFVLWSGRDFRIIAPRIGIPPATIAYYGVAVPLRFVAAAVNLFPSY